MRVSMSAAALSGRTSGMMATSPFDAATRPHADVNSLLDRWLGGVHLQGRGPAWRWSRHAGHLIEA